MIFLLALLICPFLSRSLGMKHGQPWWETTVNRFISWAIPMGFFVGALAVAYHMPWWLGVISIFTTWGMSCIGHASIQGNTVIQNEEMGFLIFANFLATFGPLFSYFIYINHVPFIVVPVLIIGLLGGFSYYFGYKIPYTFKLFGITWCTPITNGIQTTEWSEFLRGDLPYGLSIALLGVAAPWGKLWIIS